jgi:hypothetical protein
MIRGIEKKRIVVDEQDRKDFCATIGFIGRENENGGLCMGVDEQPRSFAGLQRDCGFSQVYAAAFDRLRGELQPAPSPPWSSFSEPLQVDGLRRRQLFH